MMDERMNKRTHKSGYLTLYDLAILLYEDSGHDTKPLLTTSSMVVEEKARA